DFQWSALSQSTPVIASKGVALISGSDMRISGVDLRKKQLLWKGPKGIFSIHAPIQIQNPDDSNIAIVGSLNNKIYFINPETGKVLKRIHAEGEFIFRPEIVKDGGK